MYYPTQWKDHVTNPSNCFNITKNDDGTYQITRAGTVMQQGTPQDAAHFTNQEDGIWELFACYGLLLNYARQMGCGARQHQPDEHRQAVPVQQQSEDRGLADAAPQP